MVPLILHPCGVVSLASGSPDPSERPWLVLGIAAQAMVLVGLLTHWKASRGRSRPVVPAFAVYAAIAASIALVGYALHRQEPVFVAGQALNVVIGLRAVQCLRQARARDAWPHRGFPIVAPDSAEWKKTPPPSGPPRVDSGLSPPAG